MHNKKICKFPWNPVNMSPIRIRSGIISVDIIIINIQSQHAQIENFKQ